MTTKGGRLRSTRVHRPLPVALLASSMIVPALMIATGLVPFARQDSPQDDPRWYPRYDWALEVDGRSAESAMFFVERSSGRRILVEAPELPQVAVLNISGQKVTILDRASVTIEPDGAAAMLAPGAEVGAETSSYTMDSGRVLFYVGNNRLKISPKEPLQGPATREQILSHSPIYRKGLEAYQPDPKALERLRSVTKPIEIEVVFGTWCPHCKVMVPRFMKSIEEADNGNIHVSYLGVPQNFSSFEPAKVKNIQGVPTFIFYRDGKELGRIPGEPTEGTIEQAMVKIIDSGGQ